MQKLWAKIKTIEARRKQEKHWAKITGVQVGHKNQKLANITKVQNAYPPPQPPQVKKK